MSEFSRRDLIAASRMSLQVFAERAMYELIPGYQHFRYVDLMGAYLEALIGGEMSRLIINLPPRHGKTDCAALSAFFLGKFPGLEVLNVSHSQTLAKYLSQQTFDLMETAFYKEVFPNTRIRGDRRSAGDFRTTASGGRLGVTVDSSITGRGADLSLSTTRYRRRTHLRAEFGRTSKTPSIAWWQRGLTTTQPAEFCSLHTGSTKTTSQAIF